MSVRLLVLSALVTVSTTLLACDHTVEENSEYRAIVVTDRWGIHDPWHAPDVNSCEDYWNDRCVGLSADACGILHARYSCSTTDKGVIITDHFGDAASVPAEKTWRVFSPGQPGFSEATATPLEACALLPKTSYKPCARLAAIAGAAPGLLELSPDGGLGTSASPDQVEESLAGTLLGSALEKTDWEVPALGKAGDAWLAENFPAGDGAFVILAAPDGTTAVASKDIIVLRDVRCQMDKVEVCVDVDP